VTRFGNAAVVLAYSALWLWIFAAMLLTGCATSAPGPEFVTPSVVRGPQGTDWRALGAVEIIKLNCPAEGSDAYAGLPVRELCISPRTDGNPVVEYFSGPTDAELWRLDAIARELAARTGPPIGFHCTHGCDRTGLLYAMILRYLGMSREEARWHLEHDAGGCYHGLPGVDRAWALWNRTIYGRGTR